MKMGIWGVLDLTKYSSGIYLGQVQLISLFRKEIGSEEKLNERFLNGYG